MILISLVSLYLLAAEFCFSEKIADDFATSGSVKAEEVRTLSEAISEAILLLDSKQAEIGAPCLQAAVGLDGDLVLSFAMGFADIENQVPCNENTVIRVGSISKSITAIAMAKLWEEGKLDLDQSIYHYVPSFPQKCWQGKKVDITVRQLMTHYGGIRHYTRKEINESESTEGWDPECVEELRLAKLQSNANDQYIKQPYKSVTEALNIFKYDLLLNKPGTEFYYTSPGIVLASAALEVAAQQDFMTYTRQMFKDLGLQRTYWDVTEDIIPNRSKSYNRTESHELVHAPYINKIWKLASSSVISTAKDLVHFGNMMLYSYQQPNDTYDCEEQDLYSYLKKETIQEVWTPVQTKEEDADTYYGIGWGVNPEWRKCDYCAERRFFVAHSGTSFGTRTRLMVMPRKNAEDLLKNNPCKAPLGTSVAILATVETPSSQTLRILAFDIAKIFDSVPPNIFSN